MGCGSGVPSGSSASEEQVICYYTGCARKNHRIGALIHEEDDLGFCGGPK